MKIGELIHKSPKYGWNVKTVRYLSDDRVMLEFEKLFFERKYHIYVLAGIDGVVMKGFNFFHNEIPVDSKTWDHYVM